MGSGSGDAEGHDAAPAGGENERRRPRRVVLLAVLVVVTWGITAAVFATVGAHAARSGADQARRIADTGDLSDLVNGDVDVALHAASEDFDRSRRFLASPLLVPARYLPVVGRQLRTATALAETAHRVVDSASGAVDVVRGELDVGVPGGPGRIAALDDLIAALSDLRVEIDRADLGPGDALVGPVQDARSELASRLDDARARTGDALAIARGLRDLLAGPSRYLVLAANNAEMRVGSGMFLSIGTVDFADGRLQPSSSFSPAADLLLPDPVPLPESIESLWGWSDPGSDWRNLGLSARFPPNAEVAARMWAALGRGPVDGVLVIDVPGLQAMLDVVGPVEVDGVRLDAKNVVPYLLHDQYLEADDREVNADRRERLSGLASAVLGRLVRLTSTWCACSTICETLATVATCWCGPSTMTSSGRGSCSAQTASSSHVPFSSALRTLTAANSTRSSASPSTRTLSQYPAGATSRSPSTSRSPIPRQTASPGT